MNECEALYFGQWRYESSTGILSHIEKSDDVVSLSVTLPLISQQFLLFFLLNPNRLILKGELNNLFFDKSSFTERAIFREIGTLRRMLGDDSRNPKYILTVRKRGFRFIQSVRKIPCTDRQEQSVSVTENYFIRKCISNKKIIFSGFFSLLVVLAVNVIISEYYSINTADDVVVRNISDMHGVEWDPDFSDSGLAIAYVNNIEEGEISNIVLQDLKSNKKHYIKTLHKEYMNSPVWSNRRGGIFYQRLLPSKVCELRFIKLKKDSFDPIADNFVASCGTQSHAIKIQVDKDENFLIFPHKVDRFSPSFIAKYSLESSIFQKLTSPPRSSFGDYSVSLSPDGRYLAFLRDVNRTHAQLWLMSIESGSMQMLYESDDFYPTSISWSNDSRMILFSTFNPLIQGFDIIENKLENIYHSAFPVYQVVQNKNGSYILSSGSYWNSSVWKASNSIVSNKGFDSKLFSSDDDYIIQVNPTEFGPTAVVSNRTGKNKLWFYYPDGRKICIDDLMITDHFVHGRFSNDGRNFLVRSGKHLWIVEDSGRLVKVNTREEITRSFSWSSDGLHLFYTASLLGQLRVYKFNVNTGKTELFDASIKYFEESPRGDYAIQLKQNNTQVEVVKPDKSTSKIFGLTENNLANQRAVLRDGGVYFQYYNDATDSYNIVRYNIMTDKIEFSDAKQKAQIRWLGVSRDEKFFYIHDGVKGNIDLRLISPIRH